MEPPGGPERAVNTVSGAALHKSQAFGKARQAGGYGKKRRATNPVMPGSLDTVDPMRS